jgi:hypothetical protein
MAANGTRFEAHRRKNSDGWMMIDVTMDGMHPLMAVQQPRK